MSTLGSHEALPPLQKRDAVCLGVLGKQAPARFPESAPVHWVRSLSLAAQTAAISRKLWGMLFYFRLWHQAPQNPSQRSNESCPEM